MCEKCGQDVVAAGEWIDELIRVETAAHQRLTEYDNVDHTIRLAINMRESYLAHQGVAALEDMAIGFSVAIQRLVALQQVCGLAATPTDSRCAAPVALSPMTQRTGPPLQQDETCWGITQHNTEGNITCPSH